MTGEELATEQRLLLGTGVLGACLLFGGSFLLVMSQARSEGRRSSNSLVAAGVPQSFLRGAWALATALPVAVAALLGGVAGLSACWGMLSLFGREQVRVDALWWTVLPALATALASLAWGWLIGSHRFDRRLLRE